jgi:hypothetical protein
MMVAPGCCTLRDDMLCDAFWMLPVTGGAAAKAT